MRDAEGIARRTLDEPARERLARREGYGMNDDVEPIPPALQAGERGADLVLARHVHRHRDVGTELRGEPHDAILQAIVLIGEGELCALAVHGLCDSVGDRALGGESDEQGAFAGQESHGAAPESGRNEIVAGADPHPNPLPQAGEGKDTVARE